ncbi:hypothetical protein SAMN04488066_11097 [Halorubrum aquaticum]|uniref:Uncharacterized protein n=1 Tax=Halorubrum aquaticum TaxID=387340 RepID=A0A1I3B9A9_9EURY|nr:hypothetical protein [Halorubrum aquaticum]SFH58760.1 hypothetical protein SAMN04488066_11097 [Halorubrum aquaticum]
MYRRAVVAGALAVATAGCTDRIHDLAASTPRDIAVRSRYVDDDPLVPERSVRTQPPELLTHALSFRSAARARGALLADAERTLSFVESTPFVDDGGEAVLVIAQRLAPPGIDVRLGSVSRIGDRALRVAADEIGHRPGDEDDLAVHTLLVRLTDGRGPPERVVVSIEGDRAGVTI